MNFIENDRLLLRGWRDDDYLDLHEFISHIRVGQCSGQRIVKDI